MEVIRHLRDRALLLTNAGLLLALVILLSLGTTSFMALRSLNRSNDLREATHAKIYSIEYALSILKDAETGQRGFLLINDEVYLEPYRHAVAERDHMFRDLDQRFAGDLEQMRRVVQFKDLATQRLDILAHIIAIARDADRGAAIQIVRTNRGKQIMDKIRTLVSVMREHEERVLVAQVADSASTRRAAAALEIAGSSTGFLLVLLAAWLLNVEIHRRAGLEKDIRSLNAALARKIAERTAELEAKIDESSQSQIREKAAIEASRLKSSFLANMSHEIRTPLNGVMGMTGLLLDTELKNEQRGYVETVRSSAESLLTIINDILDFSKVEAGRLDFDQVPFDLGVLLQDVDRTLGFEARKKGLKFLLEEPSGKSLCLVGDPGRLRQVLTNLLNNAIKFTSQGEVTLRIQQLEVVRDKVSLRFEIEDTGIGLAAGSLEKLFTPFSQVDASTTRKFGGTGLGLSISKQLVELMGGRIGVDSREGEGSVFWFTAVLPLAGEGVLKKKEEYSPELVTAKDTGKIRLLLAEDNPVNQKIAVTILEKNGFRVDAVGNGSEAINALSSIDYDLVLMDCQMPEMDGYEATRRVRASDNPRIRRLPIVAMTANAMKGDKEKCLAVGMDDYISKPIRTDDLLRIIMQALETKAESA